MINTRIPIIALDYKEKHKAVPKELLVDYDEGNIYIVSKNDKNIIFDITSKIKEKIDNLDGGKINIYIDGIGVVSLVDIIDKLNNDVSNTVQIIDTDDDIEYVNQESVPDHLSIEFDKRNLQLKDFKKAPNLSMPRKKDGKLEWVECEDFFNISSSDYTKNNGNIIPPSNPNDGKILYCYNIEPLNSKIFLRASKRQKSRHIYGNCKIILPRTIDEYSEINWYLITNEDKLIFSFTNNIIWRNESIQPVKNSHQIYTFKTWDYGRTWLGELIVYSGNRPTNGMNIDYLNDHYYSKQDIDNNYYSKYQMDEKYVNLDILSNKYYSKQDIDNRYYNIPEMKSILSWKSEPKNNNGGEE